MASDNKSRFFETGEGLIVKKAKGKREPDDSKRKPDDKEKERRDVPNR